MLALQQSCQYPEIMIDSGIIRDALNTDIRNPIPEPVVSKIMSRPPFINVPGVSNFRDLSHDNTVRKGFVYRSGSLADITPQGKAVLADDLGITTVFDLRNEGERERAPSPEMEGIETIWMPYGVRPASLNLRDFAGEDMGASGFVKMYSGILEAEVPAFTQVFSHIKDRPSDPFIFHCSGRWFLLVLMLGSHRSHLFGKVHQVMSDSSRIIAGKDRTGVLAALTLLLVGRPHDEIIHDYILTRVGLENVRENLTKALALHFGTDHLSSEAIGMLELSSVRAHAMESFLKTFESIYDGGIQGYLTTKLGFSEDDVEQMRRNLMTAPA